MCFLKHGKIFRKHGKIFGSGLYIEYILCQYIEQNSSGAKEKKIISILNLLFLAFFRMF